MRSEDIRGDTQGGTREKQGVRGAMLWWLQVVKHKAQDSYQVLII